jgi:hypothetical protein
MPFCFGDLLTSDRTGLIGGRGITISFSDCDVYIKSNPPFQIQKFRAPL